MKVCDSKVEQSGLWPDAGRGRTGARRSSAKNNRAPAASLEGLRRCGKEEGGRWPCAASALFY